MWVTLDFSAIFEARDGGRAYLPLSFSPQRTSVENSQKHHISFFPLASLRNNVDLQYCVSWTALLYTQSLTVPFYRWENWDPEKAKSRSRLDPEPLTPMISALSKKVSPKFRSPTLQGPGIASNLSHPAQGLEQYTTMNNSDGYSDALRF